MGDPGKPEFRREDWERLARIEESVKSLCRSIDGMRIEVRVLTDPGQGLCGKHSRQIQALESRQGDLRSGIKHLWGAVVTVSASVLAAFLAWLFHRGTG